MSLLRLLRELGRFSSIRRKAQPTAAPPWLHSAWNERGRSILDSPDIRPQRGYTESPIEEPNINVMKQVFNPYFLRNVTYTHCKHPTSGTCSYNRNRVQTP